MKKWITYGLYPTLLVTTLTVLILSIELNWDLKQVFAILGISRFAILLIVEFVFPLKNEWRMTWKTFLRDLKYMITGGAIIGLIQLALQLLAIDLAEHNTGWISSWSPYLSVIAALLFFEFFQYWYHRLSHEGNWTINRWLWKVHVPHHLPEQVYLLMHAVFHPVNFILTQIVIQGSLLLLGISEEGIVLFNAIMGLQGLISHFNVEIKAGWLNYIFVGTELHRFHHSSDVKESKNYGAVLSIWDQVFGTFYYHPEVVPRKLGVSDPEHYPKSNELWKVLKYPFQVRDSGNHPI